MSEEKSDIFIVRDTREKEGHGWTWRATKEIGGTIEEKLDLGDYSIKGFEKIVVVERKGAASELLGNILTDDNKRFKRELDGLMAVKHRFIVCEFTLVDLLNSTRQIPKAKRHFFSEDRILGAIASFSIQFGIPFMFAGQSKTVKVDGYNKLVSPARDLTKKLLLKGMKYA